MQFIFGIILVLIGWIVSEVLEGGIRTLFGERLFTSEMWEAFGELGAAACWILTLGWVRWDCDSRRAITSGVVISGATLALMAFAGVHVWKVYA